MMIGEQLKAVCCRRACVEQNWVLFSSEVLTVLRIRQFLGTFAQSQKASIAFIMSVCLTASISVVSNRRIDVKFDLRTFTKICQDNPKLIKMGQKRALYMKIKVCFIVAGNIKLTLKIYLRMKLYQAVRVAEEA
jgi:hypothetical protein